MTEYVLNLAADSSIEHYAIDTGADQIVRCRDCIYYVEDYDPIDPGWPMMCERTGDDMIPPYCFCAWGQRKEGGDD